MKIKKNTGKYIRILIIALFLLSSAFLIYHSRKLSDKLDHARLETESLLSERIHLNRKLDELRREIASITEKNREQNHIPGSSVIKKKE
jgi:hypothetical protein